VNGMTRLHRFFLPIAMTAIAACSSASDAGDDSAGDTGASEDKLLAGRVIPEAEVARILKEAGFEDDIVPTMVCTAKYESSFYERASHKNHDGTTDRGLLQVNSIHIGGTSCPKTAEGLFDAKTNAICAYVIYTHQGIRAWYGYTKHKAECDAYVLEDQ
jgi:hypothetical protein